jgi:hypothetical protein
VQQNYIAVHFNVKAHEIEQLLSEGPMHRKKILAILQSKGLMGHEVIVECKYCSFVSSNGKKPLTSTRDEALRPSPFTRVSRAPLWRLNRAAKGMRYQFPALGGQLARKLPKFFIRGGLQKHFDAVERRAVEFIGRAGQHKQPVVGCRIGWTCRQNQTRI